MCNEPTAGIFNMPNKQILAKLEAKKKQMLERIEQEEQEEQEQQEQQANQEGEAAAPAPAQED